MKIRQLFLIKMSKINTFEMDLWTFGHNNRVADSFRFDIDYWTNVYLFELLDEIVESLAVK